MEIKIRLDMPPSINSAYSNAKIGRIKTKACKEWEKCSFYKLVAQRPGKIDWDDWLRVEYNFFFSLYTKDGKKRIKDTFNYEKVLSDFLAEKIPWFEDHKIKEGFVRKIDSKEEFVEISIKTI